MKKKNNETLFSISSLERERLVLINNKKYPKRPIIFML